MKEIMNNCDNLSTNQINRTVKRAKILLINEQNEVLICSTDNSYFLLGGHVEDGENDYACLMRELEEEAGIKIDLSDIQRFMCIKHLNKDYPQAGINTESIANYYYLKTNVEPNLDKMNLTAQEKTWNFKVVNIPIDKIIDVLNSSLEKAPRKAVIEDTIEALKEFMEKYL